MAPFDVVRAAGRMRALEASAARERNKQRLKWMDWYNLFLAWPLENGERRIPIAYITPGGARLGRWQENQRQSYKKGRLAPNRVQLLVEAGIVWDLQEAAWEASLERFLELPVDKLGNRHVQSTHTSADGYRLGLWSTTQRQARKKGILSEERIQRLDDAGFIWDMQEQLWDEGLRRFAALEPDERGHRVVGQNHVDEKGFKLGLWAHTQRALFRRGELSTERFKKLDATGFVWDLHSDAWEEGLAHFLAFPADARGQREVPANHRSADGFNLGSWQHTQRTAFKLGYLSPERVEALEAAGIQWQPFNAAWDEGFASFQRFAMDKRGMRHVPARYIDPDGFQLGSWTITQRAQHRRGVLPRARALALEAAGIVWDPQDGAWEEGFAHFKEIPRDWRGFRTPALSYVSPDGYRLGAWQTSQRTAYTKGLLSKERQALLQAAGMVWDLQEVHWHRGLQKFKEYPRDSTGRRHVSSLFADASGFKLGSWLHNQRQKYKRGELSGERVQLLEAAGVVWDPQSFAWDEGVGHFAAYPPDANGKRLVSSKHVTEDGFKLGFWQTTQRTAFRRGLLSAERVQRLEELGIEWKHRHARAKLAKGAAQDCSAPPPPPTFQTPSQGPRRLLGEIGSHPLQIASRPLEIGSRRLQIGSRPLEIGSRSRGSGPRSLVAEGGGVLAAGPADAAAWHEEWRRRLGCWWLALPGPTQGELGHCMGALALHLGARLERLRGRQTPTAAAAEPGCAWLEEGKLRLPDFPSLDGFDFSLPPLPRLLPPWEELQQLHGGLAPGGLAPREDSAQGAAHATVLGAGAGSAAFAAALFLSLILRSPPRQNGRAGRLRRKGEGDTATSRA